MSSRGMSRSTEAHPEGPIRGPLRPGQFTQEGKLLSCKRLLCAGGGHRAVQGAGAIKVDVLHVVGTAPPPYPSPRVPARGCGEGWGGGRIVEAVRMTCCKKGITGLEGLTG